MRGDIDQPITARDHCGQSTTARYSQPSSVRIDVPVHFWFRTTGRKILLQQIFLTQAGRKKGADRAELPGAFAPQSIWRRLLLPRFTLKG